MSRKNLRGKWGQRLPIPQRLRDDLGTALALSGLSAADLAEMICDPTGRHPAPSFISGIRSGRYARCGTLVQQGIEAFVSKWSPTTAPATASSRRLHVANRGISVVQPSNENRLFDDLFEAFEKCTPAEQELITALCKRLAATSDVVAAVKRLETIA